MGQNVTIISNQSRSSYQRLHLGQNALLKTTEMYSQFVPRTLLQNNRQRWVTNSSRCIFSPLLRKINVLNMRYENFLLECAAGPGAIKILLIKSVSVWWVWVALPIHQYIYYLWVITIFEKALGRRMKRAPRPLAGILDSDPDPDPSFFRPNLKNFADQKIIFYAKNFSLESMKDFKAQDKAFSPLERKTISSTWIFFRFWGPCWFSCIRFHGSGHHFYQNT